MKMLIIRPEPGATASAARVRAAGFDPVCMPFFQIVPRSWHAPDPSAYDAVLVTSANAIRHAGRELDGLRALCFHAVGEHSANAICAAGLQLGATGSAGIGALLDTLAATGGGRLLWLAGEDRTNVTPPASITLDAVTVYASEPVAQDRNAIAAISACPIVALHSVRAADAFAACVDAAGLPRGRFLLAAFSQPIAQAAGTGWGGLAIAEEPTDAALLSSAQALVRQGVSETTEGHGI